MDWYVYDAYSSMLICRLIPASLSSWKFWRGWLWDIFSDVVEFVKRYKENVKDFCDNPARTFTDAAKQELSDGAFGVGRGIYTVCDVRRLSSTWPAWCHAVLG